ncbi:hypothetical protein KEM56_004630 [Ascosphaera pollenicola]|nr:hypothetical protein KEM56_004630 [Ascosphaera pollenicola]
MAGGGDLQQEILQRTLQEVKQAHDVDSNPCVICLEQVSKVEVRTVLYGFQEKDGLKEYTVTAATHKPSQVNDRRIPSRQPMPHPIALRERRRPRRRRPQSTPVLDDYGLARRRYIYKHRLFSRRVGSNRLSQYRELAPQMFTTDAALVQRARRWIRRELQVFSFLYPEPEDSIEAEPSPSSGRGTMSGGDGDRRSSNAEFLLEYIISILRTVDIKSASGSAEDLLQEFLGRDNAQLFLHELQAFLRSPYTSLRDWDAAVQYDEPAAASERRRGETSETRNARRDPDTVYPDSYIPNYARSISPRRRKRRKV